MSTQRAIQLSVLFWSLLILAASAFAGSGRLGEQMEHAVLCQSQMRQISGFTDAASALAVFEPWVERGDGYAAEPWFVDMVREMIAVYFEPDDGQVKAHAICMSKFGDKT